MSVKYFNVPADFRKETIDRYEKLNRDYPDSRIIETYGNLTLGENLGSGRVVKDLPEIDLLDLQEYVEYCREKKIEFNYTLNAPYLENREFTEAGLSKIVGFLHDLYDVGVRALTVAMPSLFEVVKFTGLDFTVKASTICHITNAHKARAFKRMGVDKIVVDESVHRDFLTLKRIRNVFGDKVEMIVNTMCHRNCMYRMFHYNQTGGDSVANANEIAVNFFEHKCLLQRYADRSELLKLGWVRPEDLKYYTAIGIRYFKLQGRQHVLKGDHVRAIECYFKESYDGDLMELLDMFNSRYSFKVFLDNKKLEGFLEPFYEKENFCRNDCLNCGYCETFAAKSIDPAQAEEMIAFSRKFYGEYDQFKKLYDSLDSPEADEVDEGDRAAGFNLE